MLTCPSRLPNMLGDIKRMLGIELMYVKGSMYPIIDWPLATTQNHPFTTLLLPATPGQIFHGNFFRSSGMLKGQEVVWALPRLKLISLVHSVAEWRRGNADSHCPPLRSIYDEVCEMNLCRT